MSRFFAGYDTGVFCVANLIFFRGGFFMKKAHYCFHCVTGNGLLLTKFEHYNEWYPYSVLGYRI